MSTPRRIEVTVPGRKRMAVALDGEKLRMDLPLKIEIADDLLQVILPPKKIDTPSGGPG